MSSGARALELDKDIGAARKKPGAAPVDGAISARSLKELLSELTTAPVEGY